jgi:hypothetical protein
MIAIIVIAVAIVYLILILMALVLPKTRAEKFLYTGIILSPLIWKVWDMPIGYANFRLLCSKEAGLHAIKRELTPAKIIRLPATSFGESSASTMLAMNPRLEAVEAGHPKFHFADVYSRYRRVLDTPLRDRAVAQQIPVFADSEDTVTGYPGTENYSLVRMTSLAEYSISEELQTHAFRNSSERVVLRGRDGSRLVEYGWVTYNWTIASNTLFGRSMSSSCPARGGLADGYDILLKIVGVKF